MCSFLSPAHEVEAGGYGVALDVHLSLRASVCLLFFVSREDLENAWGDFIHIAHTHPF